MQRIPVDFSRVLSPERVEVGFATDPGLVSRTLQEGERVVLYETGLEVAGVLQCEIRQGQPYWYALADWATKRDTDAAFAPSNRAV